MKTPDSSRGSPESGPPLFPLLKSLNKVVVRSVVAVESTP